MTLALGISTGLLVIWGGMGSYWLLKSRLTQTFDHGLLTKAQALITASEIDDDEFEIDLEIQYFAGFGSAVGTDYFEVWRGQESLERSPSLGARHLSKLPAEISNTYIDYTLPDGKLGRAFRTEYQPSDDTKNEYHHLTLVVAGETDSLVATLHLIRFVLTLFGGTAILLAIWMLRWSLAVGLRPVENLSREVQSIQAGRLHDRISVDSLPSELQIIAIKLNELLTRMQNSFESERRFSSHAAHELRTPLAELRIMTELGQKWPEEFTQDHVSEMVNVIQELEELIAKLALMASAESGKLREPGDRIDLPTGLETCIEKLRAKADQKGIRIETHVEKTEITTDRIFWMAVLGNLIGNAVEYSPPESVVDVHVDSRRIVVRNPAPNLTQNDLDKMFERFWRKDSRREDGSHSGLGLSIVRACSQALGGKCTATLSEGLLRLEVDLPTLDTI